MGHRIRRVTVALLLVVGTIGLPPHDAADGAVTGLTDCRFSQAQVFDVQWRISGGELRASSFTRPYSSFEPGGQLQTAQIAATDTFGFYENGSDIGFRQYAADGTLIRTLHLTGTFRAIGDDFIFYTGGGFYGTLITSGTGYAYGDSANLAVTAENVGLAEALGYTSCSATALAVGQTRAEVEGGGSSATVPDAPTIGTVTAGDGQLSVAFTAPGDDGGADITNYEYSTDGGATWTPAAPATTTSPLVITGLDNGTPYTIGLRAVNSEGAGTADTSGPHTPATIPGAPSIGTVTAGDGQLSVAFTAPGDDGGADITNYEYSTDGGATWTPAAPATTTSPLVITGLDNGTPYTIGLRAVNTAGSGTASSTVEATPLTTPDAPTVTAGPSTLTSVSVSWTAPTDDGGSAVTGYVVQLSEDGGATWRTVADGTTATSSSLEGLLPETAYRIRVAAVNAVGTGPFAAVAVATGDRPTPFTPPGGTPPPDGSTVSGYVRDRAAEVDTEPEPAAARLETRVGDVRTTFDVAGAGRVVPDAAGGALEVVRDRVSTVSGAGLEPGGTAEIWFLDPAGPRQLALLPVGPDGTFGGALPFTGELDGRGPLPIGPRTVQVLGVDASGARVATMLTLRVVQPGPLAPEPERAPGTPPTLSPGASLATNAGLPTAVTVTPLPGERTTRFQGDSWLLEIDVPEGTVRDQAGAPIMEIVDGDDAEVRGTGFMPGTRAYVWIMSDPTFLGEVAIRSDGTFSGSLPVDIEPGEHTLQVSGVGTDGYVRAANLGVIVLAGDGAPRPSRIRAGEGVDPVIPLETTVILLALAAGLVAVRRTRRIVA